MFHYMDHVRSLKTQGYDCHKYDVTYRRLHVSDPILYPFAREMLSLQMKCTSAFQPRLPASNRPTDQTGIFQAESSWTIAGYNKQDISFPVGTCWGFSMEMYVMGASGPTHKCCYCQDAHPGSKCSSIQLMGNSMETSHDIKATAQHAKKSAYRKSQ